MLSSIPFFYKWYTIFALRFDPAVFPLDQQLFCYHIRIELQDIACTVIHCVILKNFHYTFIMARFLFQLDHIDGVKFTPIKIDIHRGVIKIVAKEIHYDFQINNTESVIVGTDREEVLDRIQRGFERQYSQYGNLKKDDIKSLDYETMQAWKRLQKHIIK
jgi:hypothetical protein